MVRGDNDPLVQNLRAQYDACVSPSTLGINRSPNDLIRAALWVVEDDQVQFEQGTAFAVEAGSLPMALRDAVLSSGSKWALVTCAHCLWPGMTAFRPGSSDDRCGVELIAKDKDLDLAVVVVRTAPAGFLKLDLDSTLDDGLQLRVVGLPNYGEGMSAPISSGPVVGRRPWHGLELPILDVTIVAGMSGGPALNSAGLVVGVAVTGAKDQASAKQTEKHGAVPVSYLAHLRPQKPFEVI